MEKIAELSARWLEAKADEKEAQERRALIEADLLALVPSVVGGSKTTNEAGYKITVKAPIYRSIDAEKWDEVKDSIPHEIWPVKLRLEADDKGCKWLAENDPTLWSVAARAITEKPGKASFTIEKKKGE